MADGTLPQLPDDVLQVIYGEVPLRRLLAHRAVCSHFNRMLPTVLLHINLTDRIGGAGAASLSAALPEFTALQTLDLGGNDIGDAGAASLSAALPGCAALQTLDLRGGNGIGAEGAASFKSAWATAGKATGGLRLSP